MNRSYWIPAREDWLASLVVFIVALPLSLGIALASGASPASGLITAIIGGILGGMLAGAPLAVTGPAAGLAALVFQLVQQHGIQGLAVITVVCGLVQLGIGLARLGHVFNLIPKAVLEGVLTAIGFMILAGQLHVLVGARVPSSALAAVATFPEVLADSLSNPALACGLAAIVIQLVWPRLLPRARWLPAALPAVAIATLAGSAWEMPRVELAPLASTVTGAVLAFFSPEAIEGLRADFMSLVLAGVGLAVVASAESMLTARAVDVLAESRDGFVPANLDRELIAQGTANAVSGLIGGIPMTAVMVRSAANVNAGARTRWSTVLHGAWIAIFVGAIPFVLTKIPLAALAAVLVLTGFRLLNLPTWVKELRQHPVDGLLWTFTTLAIVGTDLLKGLIIALAGAAILSLRKMPAPASSIGAMFRRSDPTDPTP